MKKITVICAALLVAACSSTPKTDTVQPTVTPEKPVVVAPTANTQAANNASVDAAKLAEEARKQQAVQEKQLDAESVYFDLDQSSIKPEYQDIIKQQAAFANAHKTDVVTVSGNADERGSNEYNLALGDRRAHAAQQGLQALGVNAAQVKTVSYGEEKPRATCHEEKCWKENRRVDFEHQVK